MPCPNANGPLRKLALRLAIVTGRGVCVAAGGCVDVATTLAVDGACVGAGGGPKVGSSGSIDRTAWLVAVGEDVGGSPELKKANKIPTPTMSKPNISSWPIQLGLDPYVCGDMVALPAGIPWGRAQNCYKESRCCNIGCWRDCSSNSFIC